MQITHIFTGPDGRSHFADLTLPAAELKPNVCETAWLGAKAVSIRSVNPPGGFVEQPRHVAPRRQLAVIVAGMLEVECADRATRRFPRGAIVLIEDGHGEGHITRVVGAPCSFVQVALDDDDGLNDG
jgi:hypothetical protein